MTPASARVHSEERLVGKRAPFHVYYTTRSGALQFSPAYPETLTPEAAKAYAEAIFKQLRMKATVTRVIATDPSISL
jgi:hypothetical protein